MGTRIFAAAKIRVRNCIKSVRMRTDFLRKSAQSGFSRAAKNLRHIAVFSRSSQKSRKIREKFLGFPREKNRPIFFARNSEFSALRKICVFFRAKREKAHVFVRKHAHTLGRNLANFWPNFAFLTLHPSRRFLAAGKARP